MSLRFAKSHTIQYQSKELIMVHCVGEDIGNYFNAGGAKSRFPDIENSFYSEEEIYVPRVMFFKPAWKLLKNIYNPKAPTDRRYFYDDMNMIEEQFL